MVVKREYQFDCRAGGVKDITLIYVSRNMLWRKYSLPSGENKKQTQKKPKQTIQGFEGLFLSAALIQING